MISSPEEFLTPQETIRRPALAPWQHSIFLVVVLGLWALYGAFRSSLAPDQFPLLIRYTSAIVMQTLLVGSTIAGVYHRRTFVFGLLGYPSTRTLKMDLANGLGIFLSGAFVLLASRLAIKLVSNHNIYPSEAVRAMLPISLSELALWFLVAITAGLSEEIIFRGYLQRQLTAWSGSVFAGIVLPTLLFGSLHLYQGFANAIGITALGFVYAICASRLGNLRSVMMAHAAQDILAGLVHFLRNA